jgi:catechol 2,3-dioxygenase-like lactoylglutathione lyase family enzyme
MEPSPYYLGADQQPSEAWELAGSHPIERPGAIIKADTLAYVLFERPELDKPRAFLEDFGMLPASVETDAVYLRGHGTAPWFYAAYRGSKPRFLGAGYAVKTGEDLERIAAETGTAITDCDGPGGGQRVRLTDPDGFIVDVVHGREEVAAMPAREAPFPANTPGRKLRVNTPVRSTAAPTPLEKLGHMVLAVADFQASLQWYMRHLGVIPTDAQCLADGSPVLAFCRLDRGDEPADHHTVVLLQHYEAQLMHTAYEALDIDSIGQGAQYLKAKGWDHHWGIGRHVLGSQIFDYWRDPYGDEVEHYADGDVFTAEHPTHYYPLDRGSLWTWGDDAPPIPAPGPLTILKLVLSGRMKSLGPILKQLRTALGYKARPWLN